MNQPEHSQCGVGQRGEDLSQAWPSGVMAILIPPAVFQEVEAVFHLPMATDVGLKVRRGDGGRVETGDEVPALLGEKLSGGRTYLAIDANRNLTAGDVQLLTQIVGIGEIDPQPPRFVTRPLFSRLSWEGWADAWAKQVFNASNRSG